MIYIDILSHLGGPQAPDELLPLLPPVALLGPRLLLQLQLLQCSFCLESENFIESVYTPWPAPWPGCLGTGPPRSPQPGPAVCRGLARGFFHLQNCNSRSVHRIRIKTETQFCNVILCFVLNVHLDHVVGFPLLGPGLGADVGVDLD